MISDIVDYEDQTRLRTQVAVIGSGLAGLEIARYLGDRGLNVIVAEGGRHDFDPVAQELTRTISAGKPLRTPDPDGPHNPYLPPVFRGEGRLRQFGGTSVIWTGKWREFDTIDFETRRHVPHSGWPIGLEELLPLYREIESEYGFGDFESFAGRSDFRRLQEELGSVGLASGFHFWEGETTRPASRFLPELKASQAIQIVLGANVFELRPDCVGSAIMSAECRSLEGRRLSIEADHFVIAAGGLEAPRLLLASRSRDPAGVGNSNDLVGRFFMDHPKTKRGRFTPGPNFSLIPGKAEIFPRPRFQVSFSVSRDEQLRLGILNHALFLSPANKNRYRDLHKVARLQAAWRRRDFTEVAKHGLRVGLSKLPSLPWDTASRKYDQSETAYKAALCVEQAPNYNSRVYLSTERDAIGMPKLIVDWRFTDLDTDSLGNTIRHLQDGLKKSGIGQLEFGEPLPTLEDTTDANHPMGTTRMGASPGEGVVDSECKVFGASNLFVASSSVFATGHSFAPTLTILALARRASQAILRTYTKGAANIRAEAPEI